MKKLVLFLSIFLAITSLSFAQTTFVQAPAPAKTNASATGDLTYAMDVTSGNCIGGAISWFSLVATLDSMDIVSGSSTATIGAVTIVDRTSGGLFLQAAGWYAMVTGTGSLTMRAKTSAAFGVEVAGVEVASCSGFKSSHGNPQTNAGTVPDDVTSGALVPSAASSGDFLYVDVVIDNLGSGTVSTGTGFTGLTSAAFEMYPAYKTTGGAAGTATGDSAGVDTITIGIAWSQIGATSRPAGALTLMGVR